MASPNSGRREGRPAFQLYAADFVSSPKFRRMSLEERGAYLTLLLDAWMDHGLEPELDSIADRLCVEVEDAERLMAGTVGRCFDLVDGRLVNPRMERERERMNERSKRLSEAGAAGGRARPRRSDDQATPVRGLAGAKPGLSQAKPASSVGKPSEHEHEPEPELESPVLGSALRRATAKCLVPPTEAVLRVAREWDDHAREKGNAMTERAWSAQLEAARLNEVAWTAKVRDNLTHNTWTLKDAPPAAAGGKRRTARQEDQARAHEEGEAWERILSEHIDSALASAPAGVLAANMAPRASEDPRAAQRKPEALEGKP